MTPGLGPAARRCLKIGVVLALSLLGMALLPLLALPYGSLDWLAYDPSYRQGYCVPPPTEAIPPPTPELLCAEQPGPDEPLAARVNRQGIGLATFEREVAQFLLALKAAGVDLQEESFQAEMPRYRRQVLDRLIDDLLVQQAAVEAGLTVTPAEIQARLEEELSRSGGLDWFEGWLAETGQTWPEYERDVCQDLLRQAVFDKVTAEITAAQQAGQLLDAEAQAHAFERWLAERRAAADIEILVNLDATDSYP